MDYKPCEVERDTLRELKAVRDILMPTEKWRFIVVLGRTDYIQEAKHLLDDRQFYVPCETNPGETWTREINATLLALENSVSVTPTGLRMARAQYTDLSRLHSLYRMHKEDALFRPIVSLKGTPTYGLASWLFQDLKFLTANLNTTVCSSAQFLEKRNGISLL
ncbi:unnamed protein product [Schistocephalus solidus]|uniref:ERCC4 domain-containing protein n=1 Tax=Schistocephalus solidus TaxID=70667 RepID=A0A183SK14_SCHSO|nr:unnamed protein product [Schistocephalus solidus]